MDRILVDFIKALRGNGVRIATSETLDAIHAVDLVGYRERSRLKSALSATLAKSEEEKARFNTCFDQFFQFNDLQTLAQPPAPQAPPGNRLQQMLNGAQPAAEQAQSPLGQMLMAGDSEAIAAAMAQAASAAKVRDIRVITQKGLYGRRMMMAMGLEAMEQEMWAAETI